MPRTALLASAAAALVAASVGAGVIGAPVGSADAAASFTLTKSQFTQVQKTSVAALKKSRSNAKAIAALKAADVTGTGVPGPKGDPGGFDPSKLIRVPGAVVPVSSDVDSVPYTVPCPPGTLAISGGWTGSTAGYEKAFRVVSSTPSATLQSWSFRFAYQATAGNSMNVVPYVICAAS
jgi:hypothetical protein